MACPFANRTSTAELKLSELPTIPIETFHSMSAAHQDKIRLIIFESYVFNVSTDPSFSTEPLIKAVNTDATNFIMNMQKVMNASGEFIAYNDLDEYLKMRAKSDMLRLFCEKYIVLAKIS